MSEHVPWQEQTQQVPGRVDLIYEVPLAHEALVTLGYRGLCQERKSSSQPQNA